MLAQTLKPPAPTRRSPAVAPVHPLPVGLKARLRLGASQDEAEKQADRVADRVVASPPLRSLVPALPPPAARGQANPVHSILVPRAAPSQAPTPLGGEEESVLPEGLEIRLLALFQGGQPLPDGVRRDMETHLGMDLAAVRIHTGSEAARLNDAVGAHAFALGEHIAFAPGKFAPDHPGGRHLLAHELAHVAQFRNQAPAVEAAPLRRGLLDDAYNAATDELGDIANWTGAQVESLGMRVLEAISPEFAATVRGIRAEGILPWLGRQVARAWDGFINGLKLLIPFDGPRQLIDVFAGLVERTASIVTALASGQCDAMMEAIQELKRFVVDSAGMAWNKLAEFLQPVGQFFTDLWASFGTPAVAWLQRFGGAVWDGIQQLGHRLWQWITPLREGAAQVWSWFKGLLFGEADGDSGSSEGGLLGWLTRKGGEAWEWVKNGTRPVWQPVVELAGQVAELIPPAFVRQWAESASQLSTQLDGAGAAMNGGDGVAANRDTLAAVLPSVQGIIAIVRRIIGGAGAWLAGRIGAIAGAVGALIGRLDANPLLAWLGGAFGWLSDLLGTLLAWARDKVQSLFTLLLQGFDALSPLLQTVLETVRKVIAIYADIFQLPLIAGQMLWQRVPACIRNPVESFVQEQILARIPVFGQFFSDPELWPRVRDTALAILRRLFVDGDIAGAAWMFFQQVLAVLKVPAELVVKILAKAAGAIGDILANPLGFLGNLLRAMGAGFMGFFSRIGTHLLNGFTGWLFGTLQEAGISPPQDLSLGGILRFVMEALGITVDHIFARLSEKIGPEATARLRRMLDAATGVWSFVATLVEEGPAGLWRQLTEKLSKLWDTVFTAVSGFITEKVIGWATRWLMALLDVTGITPIINALVAIYAAIESFMAYLREILEIVSQVLDGITGIARGAIEQGAEFVEQALGKALPIAIGFLANQAGLGKLAGRIREILGTLQEKITAAIDWLIDRAIRLGQSLLDMARRGTAAVGRGIARIREWWRARHAFHSADGEEHNVYIEGSGAAAHVMVASDPQTYKEFLEGVKVEPKHVPDKTEAVKVAGKLDTAMATAAADNPQPETKGKAGKPTTENHAVIIDGHLKELADLTARFMPMGPSQSTPPIYGPPVNGFGSSATVLRLTPIHRDGKPPTADGNNAWQKVNKRKQGEGSYYVRGHLLNENLGGPGDTWSNLTPLTQAANSDHKRNFENTVKLAVNGDIGDYKKPSVKEVNKRQLRSVNFVVTARYGQPARPDDVTYMRDQDSTDTSDKADILEAENRIPVALDCQATELQADGTTGKPLASYTVKNTLESDLDHYATRPVPKRKVYLDSGNAAELQTLNGIDPPLAKAITEKGPFRTRADFQQAHKIKKEQWKKIVNTPGVEVLIYRRKA